MNKVYLCGIQESDRCLARDGRLTQLRLLRVKVLLARHLGRPEVDRHALAVVALHLLGVEPGRPLLLRHVGELLFGHLIMSLLTGGLTKIADMGRLALLASQLAAAILLHVLGWLLPRLRALVWRDVVGRRLAGRNRTVKGSLHRKLLSCGRFKFRSIL